MPNFDVIMPDHRGTGYSSFLDCPGADDVEDGVRQQMACVNQTVKEHGPDYLAHFNPTEAALDLMHAIAAHARLGEEKAFVYSVSYGTYWANRYLQIAPKQPSAVVVDGICSGGLCRIQTYDTNVDMVGGALLDLCDASAECSQNLGGRSARSLAEETFAALDAGTLQCGMRLLRHYNINLTRAVLSKALAIQLMLWQTRVLTVPVIQRLSRCSSDDAAELAYFFQFSHLDSLPTHSPIVRTAIASLMLSAVGASAVPNRGSTYLGNNILMSEMFEPFWRGAYTEEEIDQLEDRLMFSVYSAPDLTKLHKVYPKYGHDQYTHQTALLPGELPLVGMGGTLDPATPYPWAVNYTNMVKKPLLTFPQAPHFTLVNSPVNTAGAMDCAQQIVLGFFISHGQKIDRSCLNDLQILDLGGKKTATKLLSNRTFGTFSLWG